MVLCRLDKNKAAAEYLTWLVAYLRRCCLVVEKAQRQRVT
jgi:hypothetical protein